MSELTITCPEGADSELGANRDGAYRVAWAGPEGATFRLVETANGSDTTTIYQGAELASTITGRPAGDYAYSVATLQEGSVTSRSETCLVKVRPYSLAVALGFFSVGLIVTLLTVGVVLRGHRAHRRGELG